MDEELEVIGTVVQDGVTIRALGPKRPTAVVENYMGDMSSSLGTPGEIGGWAPVTQAPSTALIDLNGARIKVGDRAVWASKSPRDYPHPRVGMVTKVNLETETVTLRADLPETDRGSSSTVPASRVMRVISVPTIGFNDLVRV